MKLTVVVKIYFKSFFPCSCARSSKSSVRWPIARVVNRREFGSRGAGNLVIRWTVLIGARTKTLWWEAGRWFVVAKGGGPRP